MEPETPKSPSRAKALFQRFFDYKAWSDWDRSRSIAFYFINMVKKIFVPQKINKENIKSFATVVEEMKLTEEDLIIKQKSLKKLCVIMLVTSFIFYVYSMYQVLYGSFLGVILSVVLTFVCLTLAFRYHFWYFQISNKKLGCTLKEWFTESFMSGDR
ncbi:MAG: type IVB secretion system protein IcmV [Legionellaceae bacterium]|nr:type IVB secretion system protein IcmV [Legionellaceae bacterium]